MANCFVVSRRTIYRWLLQVSIEELQEEYTMLKGTKLLTFKQVAEILNCSKSSVYRWAIEEDKIPYVKICNHTLRIREEDLSKVIKEKA
jgi:excisionase family DNA binding protein